jgi:hypothetical protein
MEQVIHSGDPLAVILLMVMISHALRIRMLALLFDISGPRV